MTQDRYVILRHELPDDSPRSSHWDVMLEVSGSLRTWAVAVEPRSGAVLAARPLPVHRLAYLDYEGPISLGRGTVTRVDSGTYEVIADSETETVLQLRGTRVCGRLTLQPTAVAET